MSKPGTMIAYDSVDYVNGSDVVAIDSVPQSPKNIFDN
jgi:hypothetical protein